MSERRLTGDRKPCLRLGEVKGARTQTRRGSTTRLNRLVLETATGVIPLEKGLGPIDRTRTAEAVNAWLSRVRPG